MAEAGFDIRTARPADAPRIEALYRLLVPGRPVAVLPGRIEEIRQDPNTLLAVSDHRGDVGGTALLCLCRDPMYGMQPFGLIENVVVEQGVRRQGVGSALLAFLERAALAADCSKIMLLSASFRNQAHAFFEKAGYGARKAGFVKYRRDLGATFRTFRD